MGVMAGDEKHNAPGPDPSMTFDPVERVEFAPDFEITLTVPFTAEQLAVLERIGHERGLSAIGAVQQLVEEAIAERAPH